jgi:uncharacterized OB-fold protein
MKKSNFAPIQNYRKHKIITAYLGKTGTIEQITTINNPNPKQYYSGTILLVKLENGETKSVALHSEDKQEAKVGHKIELSLRLEAKNQDGLKNYGLVAKLI